MNIEAEVKRKAINELHPDTRILINYLKSGLKNGQTEFAYSQLGSAIGGRDVQNEARGLLMTARKRVQQDCNIILSCVMNFGIKVTDDYAGVMDSTIKSLGRSARRRHSEVANAINDSFDGMDDAKKTEIAANVSVLGLVGQFTRKTTLKKIRGKIQHPSTMELPVKETLKMFE